MDQIAKYEIIRKASKHGKRKVLATSVLRKDADAVAKQARAVLSGAGYGRSVGIEVKKISARRKPSASRKNTSLRRNVGKNTPWSKRKGRWARIYKGFFLQIEKDSTSQHGFLFDDPWKTLDQASWSDRSWFVTVANAHYQNGFHVSGTLSEAKKKAEKHTGKTRGRRNPDGLAKKHAAWEKEFRKYARDHYNDGGWDTIVEAKDKSELIDMFEGATNKKDAWRNVKSYVSIWKERDSEIYGGYDRSEGGGW